MEFMIIGALAFLLINLVPVGIKRFERRSWAKYDKVAQAVHARAVDAEVKVARLLRATRRWHGEESWQHAWAQLTWAQHLTLQGDYEEAVAANRKAIAIEAALPVDHFRIRTDGHEALAQSCSILGRFDEAHAALDEAERAYRAQSEAPSGDAAIAPAMEMRARVAKREGDHARSHRILERLCDLLSASPPGVGPYRGSVQREAVDTSRDALDLEEMQLRLANALFTLGRVEEAIQTEQTALSHAAPESLDRYTYGAACRYVREGNGGHALRLLKRLLVDPECSESLQALSAELVAYLDMAAVDILPRTLQVLERIPESTPGYPRLRRAVAYLRFEADQIDDGVSLLDAPPSAAFTSLALAYSRALWRNGEHAAAHTQITTLEQKLNTEGTALSWLEVASWHYERGAILDARHSLKCAKKLALARPLSVVATQVRTSWEGDVLQAHGRFEEAVSLYEAEAKENKPLMSRALAQHCLGTLHVRCGRYDLAQEHLEEVLATYAQARAHATDTERALAELCDAQLRCGNPGAGESYEELERGARAQGPRSQILRLRVDARMASATGVHDDALAFAQEALGMELRCFGEESPEVPDCYLLLSEVLRAAGEVENAVRAADDAARAATARFGEEHPTTIQALRARGLEPQEVAAEAHESPARVVER